MCKVKSRLVTMAGENIVHINPPYPNPPLTPSPTAAPFHIFPQLYVLSDWCIHGSVAALGVMLTADTAARYLVIHRHVL